AANAAVSPASSATAASATLRKASASRRPSVPPRGTASAGTPSGCIASRGGAGPGSVIVGQAEAVTAAEHGLHDLGVAGILLDLAAQVLHVRVDGALV